MSLSIKRARKQVPGPAPLRPGDPAPEFELSSTAGGDLSLEDLRGHPVVLAFYPADHSPVCSNQLAFYNEVLPLFEEHDAQLVGISVDDLDSHRAFAEDLNLSFPLLSDDEPRGAVARAYGVFHNQDNICERALFVIDDEGVIRWSYLSPRGVNPGAHGILATLEDMETEAEA